MALVGGGGMLMRQFEKQRPCFLRQALDDAKKWCVAPETEIAGKKGDQHWLKLFSSVSENAKKDDVHNFLVGFQLANRGMG